MKRRLLALTLAGLCLFPMVALADQPALTPEPEGSFWDRLFELPLFDYLAALVSASETVPLDLEGVTLEEEEDVPLDPEEPPTEAGPRWTPWG